MSDPARLASLRPWRLSSPGRRSRHFRTRDGAIGWAEQHWPAAPSPEIENDETGERYRLERAWRRIDDRTEAITTTAAEPRRWWVEL